MRASNGASIATSCAGSNHHDDEFERATAVVPVFVPYARWHEDALSFSEAALLAVDPGHALALRDDEYGVELVDLIFRLRIHVLAFDDGIPGAAQSVTVVKGNRKGAVNDARMGEVKARHFRIAGVEEVHDHGEHLFSRVF